MVRTEKSCRSLLLALACLCFFIGAGLAAEDNITVLDSRGEVVAVPVEVERVVSISDGLIEGVMISLGIEDKLVGVGSRTFQ